MTNILQFKITLLGSQPLIWRQFQVTDDYRFDRFHQVVFLVMGWMNSHLHEFDIGERKIGMLLGDGMDLPGLEDETKIFLKDMNFKEGDAFRYLYDFGDNWEHLLEVEKVTVGALSAPSCLNGQNACPLEDCGGIYSYNEMLRNHNEADGTEDEEGWDDEDYLGVRLPFDYTPSHYDIHGVNSELAKFGVWHRKHPRAKATPWHQI
jgi:hypothetical protein